MELLNVLEKPESKLTKDDSIKFIKIVSPFAPFITDELYNKLEKLSDGVRSIHVESWPVYDNALISDDVVSIAVQVNGKLKGVLGDIEPNMNEDTLKDIAKKQVNRFIGNREIIKVIVVKNRLVNFVVKNT